MIDIHTHILPMIDDGPTSVLESLEMCRIAVNDGITKMVATPHIQNGLYNSDAGKILENVQFLNQRIKQEGLNLEILPGAEVYLNDQLLDMKILNESSILTLNNGKKYILLEFSFQWVPPETAQVIFRLKSMGFTPILPHLERNSGIQSNPQDVKRFIELGAIIQVTAQSIIGEFGSRPKKCVMWMIKNNLVHVIASDAHSSTDRPPILSGAFEVVADLVGVKIAERMVTDHPKMIVEGVRIDA